MKMTLDSIDANLLRTQLLAFFLIKWFILVIIVTVFAIVANKMMKQIEKETEK